MAELDNALSTRYANLKFRDHFTMVDDLLMKYHPNVAREKYDDFKQHIKYIQDDIRASWKVSLSDIYSEYYEK